MKLICSLFRHLAVHRELYLFPLLGLLLAWLGIVYVNNLTGRPVIDDPGAIVGWLYNVVGCLFVVFLTGQTQHHLIGYRSEKHGATLTDDIFDTCVTFSLLGFFAWLVLLR